MEKNDHKVESERERRRESERRGRRSDKGMESALARKGIYVSVSSAQWDAS